MTSWRLELFFKSAAELRLQTAFLRAHQSTFSGVNLTNKSKDDSLLESVKILQDAVPGLDICVHYSIKYNYARSPQQSFANLTNFLENIRHTDTAAAATTSVLLVSGSGTRRGLDTVIALDKLDTTLPPLYVAFNPYLQSKEALQVEYSRLRSKLLSSSRVRGIYLQMGSDLAALESGLDYVQSVARELETANVVARGHKNDEQQQKLEIFGSIFLPSKKLLAQMKFRPWNGVFLSDEYLSSVENAESITSSLLKVYRKRGVVPLLESAVKSTEELLKVQKMMGN